MLYCCLCIRKYLFVYSVEEGVPKGHIPLQGHMGMQIRSLSLEGLTRFDEECHRYQQKEKKSEAKINY